MTDLSYCAQHLKNKNYDRFLLALFVPAHEREAVLAVYALNVELKDVHDRISEEMIGHIRYAWWEEVLTKPPPGQPVLEALQTAQVPAELLLPLVQAYRSAFPNMPDVDALLEKITLTISPKAEKTWHRARNIISQHRKKYGPRRNSWLSFKLLMGGL